MTAPATTAGPVRPGSGVAGALRAALRRPDTVSAALVGVLFVAVVLFPKGMPAGIYGSALVFGARSALAVTGIILVYRSNRIINFAQIQLGAVGAMIFFQLVKHHTILRGVDAACGCLPADLDAAPGWAAHLEYWTAVLVALVVSVVLSLATYLLVVRRFRDAPPLVGTVATIAVAQVLVWATERIPPLFDDEPGGTVPPPLDVSFTLDPAVFRFPDIAAVVGAVAALAGISVFLHRSRIGIGVRASAENSERASSLGVNTTQVGSSVWALAGLLSGLTAVLLVMSAGGGSTGASVGSLVRILAAAVIAGMVNLPLAVMAALGLAVLDAGFLWSWGNGALLDLVIFGLLLGFLVLRPQPRTGRVDPTGGSWQPAREIRPTPVELRGLPAVNRLKRRAGIGLAVVLLGFPFVMSPGQTADGTVMLVYGMVGLSLLLLTGWAGLISLGQFAFAAIGGFGVAWLGGELGLPFLPALLLAGLGGAVASVVVGLPALRIRGLYLAVTTLSFAVVVTNVLLSESYGARLIPSTLERPSVLGLDTNDERVFYFLALAMLGLFVVAVMGMRRSRSARALIASRDNDRAAQAFGINLVRARLETFAVSGLLAALAGGLFAYQQGGLAAGNFSTDVSLTMFLMVVIGGLGSIAGPLLGAFFVGGLTIFVPGYVGVYSAGLLLVILLFVPGGLAQALFAGRDALLRRIALRNRIRVPSLLADGRAWGLDEKAPLRPKVAPGGVPVHVPERYRLPHRSIEVAKVAAAGKGRL